MHLASPEGDPKEARGEEKGDPLPALLRLPLTGVYLIAIM